MPKVHHYYVYILSSRSRTLYIGITNNLHRRLAQHRAGKHDSFATSWPGSSIKLSIQTRLL